MSNRDSLSLEISIQLFLLSFLFSRVCRFAVSSYVDIVATFFALFNEFLKTLTHLRNPDESPTFFFWGGSLFNGTSTIVDYLMPKLFSQKNSSCPI